MQFLEASIGASFAICIPGGRQIHLLNEIGRDLLSLYQRFDGEEPHRALSDTIATRYGLDCASASIQAAAVLAMWQTAGLIAAEPGYTVAGPSENWVIPLPASGGLDAAEISISLLGYGFGLYIGDESLRACVLRTLSNLKVSGTGHRSHKLRIVGDHNKWTLFLNDEAQSAGSTADDAALNVLGCLIDLACRAEERLLVVHGAGLTLPDGTGLLLCAPGGSGKTTLATALNAAGIGLLSDDLVPVDMDGNLLSIHTPICLKPGSWGVVSACRADVLDAVIVLRQGSPVRLLAPVSVSSATAVKPRLMVFPRYEPGKPPVCRPASPEESLQRIIEAGSVIRDLTQAKLRLLTQWVSAIPAFVISYPDLEAATEQVRLLLKSGNGRKSVV